jgi:hypothetical protein
VSRTSAIVIEANPRNVLRAKGRNPSQITVSLPDMTSDMLFFVFPGRASWMRSGKTSGGALLRERRRSKSQRWN